MRAPGLLAVSVSDGAAPPDIEAATLALRARGEAVIDVAPGSSVGSGKIVCLTSGVCDESGSLEVRDTPRITPPGAAAWSTADGWRAATDTAGLYHLYIRQGEGWAALSTSAASLGLLARPAPDRSALGVSALVGHALGNATVVSDVRKLGPAQTCEVSAGRLHIVDSNSSPAVVSADWSDDAAARRREGASVLRSIVGDAIEHDALPLLELSGGLDSRVLLATIPRSVRRGLEAVTLGAPDSPDVTIAQAIAARSRLAHRVIDLRGIADLEPEDAERLAVDTGRRADWAGNPVALAVLAWAETRIGDDRPRLSGQNGEFGRGFYYGLLPGWLPNVPASVDALARWRVLANDRVDADLLRTDARLAAEAAALQAIRRLVPRGELLAATDELYLAMRMARWLGPVYTLAARSRTVVAPFLDDRYLDWVRSTSPMLRRGSRALAGVLTELDPELAEIPLAGGSAPSLLASGRLRNAGATARRDAGKAMRKVRQRISPVSRAPDGASVLAQLIQRAWASKEDALESTVESPLVRPETVEEIRRGRRPASPATVGFLLALDSLERTDLGC